ncbi:MAG: helicase-related protein, partial [Phototrophicaceae bacterium]
ERMSTWYGRADEIVVIHGGIRREERREIEDRFRNDPNARILLATDAAGEGINLQRAHLMVNYDLPWNPNRLEQRFGRIHRIGQTEVCHLWNLVAGETREGAVYQRLLKKLEAERHALDGQVFDVLGKLFQETPLRRLLVDAVRYGDDPAVRARLEQAVDNATDRAHVQNLIENQALFTSTMDVSQIVRIREDMERATARRLQPFYIKSFFLQAFEHFGGTIHERETGRYTIHNVPAVIRNYAKDKAIGAVSLRYERICFEKALIDGRDGLKATFVCPGHPLLDATLRLLLERHSDALKRGAILVDETDPGTEPRALFYLEQAIKDASTTKTGEHRTVSREVHFVEVGADGAMREAGGAPYLDYRPARADEIHQIADVLDAGWLQNGAALERKARDFAVEHLAPRHLEKVRKRRIELVDKTEAAVHERLTKEINYWDLRAAELRAQEKAGKVNARLNSGRAQERANQLVHRLKQRKEQLDRERQISAVPPVTIGGALIIPIGLLLRDKTPADVLDRQITEQIAMQAVWDAEIGLGNHPKDVSAQNIGYDIESHDPHAGMTRFIEVKGRRAGADTVTITRNEILTALNAPERFILALVEVEDSTARPPRYVQHPFTKEPDFNVTSVIYDLGELLKRSTAPI